MHPSDSASCLGVASAAPSANSFSFFLLLYNVAPLHSQTLSLSAHFVFHCPSFLCVCLYSLPGAVEGTLPSFRGGRGWCSIKEKGHLSGVRARTNNSPRPPFPPHSAESLCIKYIVCSPLHSFFFFFPRPSCFRAEVDASSCCAQGCLCVACTWKARYTMHAEANKEKSRGGSSSFKKRSSVLSHSWPAWPTLFLLHLAKFLQVVLFATLACRSADHMECQCTCITISKKVKEQYLRKVPGTHLWCSKFTIMVCLFLRTSFHFHPPQGGCINTIWLPCTSAAARYTCHLSSFL